MRISVPITTLFLLVSSCLVAAELRKIENLRLVKNHYNDGDSFHATDGEQNIYLRLYFVDTPESHADSATLARRVREQTRYFGLEDHAVTVAIGKAASEFTAKMLKQPFTAYTSHADAGGRSNSKRVYAFIETADGKDLAKTLVKEGLARAYGLGRVDHNGVPMSENKESFKDMEAAAMLARKGIWQYTQADRIAALRAEQRREDRELTEISQATSGRPAGSKININIANEQELTLLSGVGPATAKLIIEHRPFTSEDDLTRVPGIGIKTAKKLREQIVFDEEAETKGE